MGDIPARPRVCVSQRAYLKREMHGGGILGLHAVDGRHSARSGGETGGHSGQEGSAAAGDQHDIRFRRLFGDFPSQRGVAGDEGLVVQRVDEDRPAAAKLWREKKRPFSKYEMDEEKASIFASERRGSHLNIRARSLAHLFDAIHELGRRPPLHLEARLSDRLGAVLGSALRHDNGPLQAHFGRRVGERSAVIACD